MFGQILLQILLIFCCSLFTCAEITIISFNDAKLDKLSADGNRQAQKLKKLTGQTPRFLIAIRTAVTFLGFLGAAFAAKAFSEPLASSMTAAGLPFETDTIEILSLILIILLLSFFTLIFAELIPQHLAAKPAESFALGVSGLVLFTSGLLTPLVWLMNAFANGILKLFGVDPKTEDEIVTEEEILMMSDAGAEKGTIDEEDNKIIKNIFAFDDLTLEQICTHITDVIFLFEEKDENSWHETICNHRHRKFPICGSEIDDIIGILDVNDYFRLEDKSRENIMKNAVKEPFFVHEYMKADILLNKMKNHEAEHFAVVIDEYGGVSGIITVTDLVERLIGDFSETSSNTLSEEIKKTGENEWCASGIISLGDVAGVLGIELPSDTFDTLGGYLMSYASVFSKDTSVSHIDTDLLEADILKVHNHRIEKCRLRIKQPAVSSD